jgi:CDP-diacylglycerol pyrophosphatase
MTRLLLLAALVALAACGERGAERHDRNGLLKAMQACLAEEAPQGDCTLVDRAAGFVVLKDDSPEKPRAWLIVPDHEVTGIEDPRALRAPVVNFWSYGWEVGADLVPAPAARRALAINSRAGRTQDLLHIHISCVLPDVASALEAAAIGPEWAEAPLVELRGRQYNARKVASLSPSPFLRLLEIPEARRDMGAQSLAVVGSPDGGYYLVTDATAAQPAETEDLLDETCS